MATEKKRPHKETPSDLSAAPPTKKPKKKATLELADLPSFIFDPEFGMLKTISSFDSFGGLLLSHTDLVPTYRETKGTSRD